MLRGLLESDEPGVYEQSEGVQMNNMLRIKEILTPEMILECKDWEPVGSRITCNPAPTDTDEDWLLLVKSINIFVEISQRNGWLCGLSLRNRPEFASLRLNEVNLIITEQIHWWDKFLAASSVAKRFNLLSKGDRIALFRAVLYGERA